MAPIRREDPIGAIGAYWAEVGRPTAREMETVQSLADASALAVANVELYAELRAKVDSERAARQAAEEADRLKGEFLATLSHELRTPLHVMRGWLWRLRQPNVTPDVQERGLEVVERNATLQARLVDDLLDASRAMWGTMQLETRPVDLCALCHAIAESAAPAAEGRRVTLQAVLPDRPVTILGDPERLEQILGNLVSNAIKFSSPGGRIRLVVTPRPDVVRVEVADEGIGMDPAFLPHAFDAFRQADTGTTRRYGGLGLGLALVRHLTELHGGTVHASSAGTGQGTTVTLELPLLQASGQALDLAAAV
jgi:signal transduction histidine kinase